jgi:hypothetical protein
MHRARSSGTAWQPASVPQCRQSNSNALTSETAAQIEMGHSRFDRADEIGAGLRDAAGADVAGLRSELEASGWRVFVLPGGITGRVSFFQAIRNTIPLNPPLVGDSVWDALSDSLFGGLLDLGDESLAIIWSDSTVMAGQAPAEFEFARSVLTQVAEQLANSTYTVGNPKRVAIVLT